MDELYRLVSERMDRTQPALAALTARVARQEYAAAARELMQYFRARLPARYGRSLADVQQLRDQASPAERATARQQITAQLDRVEAGQRVVSPLLGLGWREHVLGLDAELMARKVRLTLAHRDQWAPPWHWGIARNAVGGLATLLLIPEVTDDQAVVFAAWAVLARDEDWKWAAHWDDAMLGHTGHNWWVTTYGGFCLAGLLFPEFVGFAQFRALSQDWLEREIRMLLEPDGFSKERSGYHYGTVQELAELARVAELNGGHLSAGFHERLQAGLATTWKLSGPVGIPHLGDGFGGNPPSVPGDPNRVLPHEGDDLDTCLPHSGYYVMRQNWTGAADWLCLDAGKRGQKGNSHDHTSMFHFELCCRGRLVLGDNGSGPYGDSPERMFRVASAAHNVATVDGKDHLELCGEWAWHGELHPFIDAWVTTPDYAYFDGAHEGYKRLAEPVSSVRRKVFYLRGRYWIVMDRFDTMVPHQQTHEYTLHFWPTAPHVLLPNGRLQTSGPGGNLLLVPVPGASGEPRLTPNPYPLPNYDNPDHLTYTRHSYGQDIFVTLLVPFVDDAVPEVAVRLAEVIADGRPLTPHEATALELTINGETHFYFDLHTHWNLPWRSGKHHGTGRLYHSAC